MKLRNASPQLYEKSSFTHPPSCILSSFSQNVSRLLLPKRPWKCESKMSFWKWKRKVVFLLIYQFNYDSSKSTFPHFKLWHLASSWAKLLSNKLEFFVSCNNIKVTSTSFFLLCVSIWTFSWWLWFSILTSMSNSHFQQ